MGATGHISLAYITFNPFPGRDLQWFTKGLRAYVVAYNNAERLRHRASINMRSDKARKQGGICSYVLGATPLLIFARVELEQYQPAKLATETLQLILNIKAVRFF